MLIATSLVTEPDPSFHGPGFRCTIVEKPDNWVHVGTTLTVAGRDGYGQVYWLNRTVGRTDPAKYACTEMGFSLHEGFSPQEGDVFNYENPVRCGGAQCTVSGCPRHQRRE